ncbi:hypothetical protein FKM82_027866 [Ascaphus truei]
MGGKKKKKKRTNKTTFDHQIGMAERFTSRAACKAMSSAADPCVTGLSGSKGVNNSEQKQERGGGRGKWRKRGGRVANHFSKSSQCPQERTRWTRSN